MRTVSYLLGQKISLEDILALHSEAPELIIERDAAGCLVIQEPTGFYSGSQNSELSRQVGNWNVKHQRGVVSDSSTGFLLPNDALRSPDVAWVSQERLAALSPEQLEGFPPLVPDFVIELRSRSDQVPALLAKMEEYRSCGVRLGWLIDPLDNCVHIYREDGSTERLEGFDRDLSGESVLEDFLLDLRRLR
jgi:Uma2 family endonuclease